MTLSEALIDILRSSWTNLGQPTSDLVVKHSAGIARFCIQGQGWSFGEFSEYRKPVHRTRLKDARRLLAQTIRGTRCTRVYPRQSATPHRIEQRTKLNGSSRLFDIADANLSYDVPIFETLNPKRFRELLRMLIRVWANWRKHAVCHPPTRLSLSRKVNN